MKFMMTTLEKYALLIITALFITSHISAQEKISKQSVINPPVGVEGLFGNRGMTYQLIINKKMQSVPRLGVFSVTNLVAEWDSSPMTDVMTQSSLTYLLFKGLDLAAGFHYTPVTGIRPSAGVMYSFGTPEFLFVANPRIDLRRDAAAELMMLSEYKPRLNGEWALYTRLQGLYGLMVDNTSHARSYIQLRAGLTYKDITFGLGANFDWYGPLQQYEQNIGGFVSINLF